MTLTDSQLAFFVEAAQAWRKRTNNEKELFEFMREELGPIGEHNRHLHEQHSSTIESLQSLLDKIELNLKSVT